MKTTFKISLFSFRFLVAAFVSVLFAVACSSEPSDVETDPKEEVTTPAEPVNNPAADPLACRKKPSQIIYGLHKIDVKYNDKDQVVEFTTNMVNDRKLSDPPIKTVYTVSYNAQGKPEKVNNSTADKADGYYVLEYNTKDQLSKQSEYDAEGKLVYYTNAEYDAAGLLSKITTFKQGNDNGMHLSNIYEFNDGNLIKKTTKNLFDNDSKEYYNADYKYTYEDKEMKVKPIFDGPLGLRILANIAQSPTLQYQSVDYIAQYFQVHEASASKNMLKNIEIIAHRYGTRDTMNIDYSYEYDADGFPTFEKAVLKNITRRKSNGLFGAEIITTTPHNQTVKLSIEYKCK
ncbi:hypothetical protein [Flavobacterium panici]|uniref:DUF4595 domain-containing protein n=1 Tax=Flavobacterium panici TaxID=2654843 RepID=A0A9N8J4I9_9FLAO|nr:hypothetical protein [Flavobacterium panici]CAC9975461.1 hypothetical protein FLAPXU55_03174 [Flavobacterium panici]